MIEIEDVERVGMLLTMSTGTGNAEGGIRPGRDQHTQRWRSVDNQNAFLQEGNVEDDAE
jgi:hypothetical protein